MDREFIKKHIICSNFLLSADFLRFSSFFCISFSFFFIVFYYSESFLFVIPFLAGSGHKFNWNFPIEYCKLYYKSFHSSGDDDIKPIKGSPSERRSPPGRRQHHHHQHQKQQQEQQQKSHSVTPLTPTSQQQQKTQSSSRATSLSMPSTFSYIHHLSDKRHTKSRNDMIEDISHRSTRVRLKHVRKVYTQWKCFKRIDFEAITNINMSLQKGEITAILGHNGAGKTTIFNILAGLQPATEGYIRIFGQDPQNAWDAIKLRKITGVCTQFDVFDDKMTVLEHIKLFGAIKGLSPSTIRHEAYRLFKQLELTAYSHTFTNLLPGGDKRKLSVAIALLGSPRLIMLDEPTSGVDPFSRRCIWRALIENRSNRVIVFITHHMDEADVLADRKAIVIGGKLICFGTSKFLKTQYRPGYVLSLTVITNQDNLHQLKSFILNISPEISLLHEYRDQLQFFIQPTIIQDVMNVLFNINTEKVFRECDVVGIGISVTSLEEIFLKISKYIHSLVC
ncbi:unnamed protein product [Trichobilharzia regenti]|nr:unnamed protein product [Trichobilharzia regenti]